MSLRPRDHRPRRPARPPAPGKSGGGLFPSRISGERPGHAATTAHLQAAYPFVAEGGLGGRGVYIGRDAYGGSFVYDPWELYGRELTSPNMLVIGQIGRAKSSLVKTYVWRQSVFRRRAWIIDPKGEYGALADAFDVQPLALEPGGTLRLNPIGRQAGWQGQLRLLQAVCA
ncbi:MAG: ATP-binding protein, partial [Actinomycetes bacterium]